MTGGKIRPVILAGGRGRRLWPLSRASHPKQFLALTGHHGRNDGPTMLQATLQRVTGPAFAPPLVMAGEAHRFLAAEQLRTVAPQARLVLEPVPRNTAPTIAAAALLAMRDDPGALLLILPADHRITRPAALAAAIDGGLTAAADRRLVIFGLPPDRPETGYGYIETAQSYPASPNTYYVKRFIEKPTAERAEALLGAGNVLWNSGMVLARAEQVLADLGRHAPAVLRAACAAVAGARADLDALRLAPEAFAAAPAISFDHAVLEKTGAAVVVAADMGWSDLGTWAALWEAGPRDEADSCRVGNVITRDVRGSYVSSDGPLVAALGVDNLVMVATADVVLAVPRDRVQEVAGLAAALESQGRAEAQRPATTYRPWGRYRVVTRGPGHLVKELDVRPGAALSLQRHRHRAEHWVVVAGRARVTCAGRTFELTAGQSAHVPVGELHRLENPGPDPLRVIEVQTGAYLGEDDIERFDPPPGAGDGSA